MRARQTKNGRRFAWQALLILLPLCLLATLGVVSLRQDRLLAKHGATERAREIAESLTSQIWAEIQRVAEQAPERFCVDASGKLVYPPPAQNTADLSGGLEDLGSSEARALFAESLEHAKAQRFDKAVEGFAMVAQTFPDATGETGVPLRPLAEYKILELNKALANESPERPNLSSFCSNLVHQPTAMTTFLLAKARELAVGPEDREVLKWEATWAMHERVRDAYHTASLLYSNVAVAPPFISESIVPAKFLASTSATDTNRWFALVSAQVLESAVRAPLMNTAPLPSYLAVRVHLGGAPFPLASKAKDGSASGETPELLASSGRSEQGAELVRVDVLLASPSKLYAHQRTRTYWFGALIALSAGAAFLGLAGAWISFREQARLNEMKSNFVSSVSHELRAPIASVRLMAENLERGAVTDESKRAQYFRLIGHECRRLSSLIENVLDFSRIEQDRKQYEFEASDLARIVSSTVQLMQPMAEQKQINLEQAASPKAVPSLAVDGKALQQALVNLIDNAIKHSPKGSTVTAGLDPSQDGAGVELWVQDQGVGIPESEHERIFERFHRLGSELRRETQGVGIGLSIVKHVVEAHGGRVRVRSAPGQGSRFTIHLPVGVSATNNTQ